MLTETWLDRNSRFDMYKMKNFNSIKCSRDLKLCDKKSGGGILVYIRNSYIYKVLFSKSDNYCEMLGFELSLNNTNSVLFICIYRSPFSDINKFLSDLESLLECFHDRRVVIGGDLNIDLFSHDSKSTQYHDLLTCHNVIISNKAVTRNANETLIDHVLTLNLPNEAQSITSEKSSISDHNMIITLINMHNIRSVNKKSVSFNKFNYDLMRENFFLNIHSFLTGNPDEMTYSLLSAIKEAMDLSSITHTYKLNLNDSVPVWANETFFKLSKRISNIEKKIGKLKKRNKPTNKLTAIQLNVISKLNEYNSTRAQNYYSDLIRENPSRTWHVVNKVLGREKKRDPGITLNINGILINDGKIVAENLADYLESNLAGDTSPIIPTFLGPQERECMFFQMVTYEEIFEILMSLDSKKAAGSDGIPGKVIKELVKQLVVPLTELINKTVATSQYPQQFKEAHIIPIFKGGDKVCKENYRGISLLPILNKVMELVMLSRVNSFLRHTKLNDPFQYGFKSGFGTNEAIFKFLNDTIGYLDENKMCIVVFVDISKAFDCVKHNVLLYKLEKIGIKGLTLDLFKSYLSNRSFEVRVENKLSSKKNIKEGVPQGGAASPNLFNINQIDIQYLDIAAKNIKFADDLLIYSVVDKTDLISGINSISNDLSLINEYYSDNGLSINFRKTSFMILSNTEMPNAPESIYINGTIRIDKVKEQKYLGIIIDDNLNFKSQAEELIGKISDSLKALRIIRNHLPTHALLQFFHAHFMSHLYYCAFIYSKLTKEELKRIQRLQNWCIKAIFRLDSTHETVDLFKTYMPNTLPVIGVIYTSMIVNIKKSLIFNTESLPKFEVVNSITRANGSLKLRKFNRKNRLGIEAGYLGAKLFNQLPDDVKMINKLGKFKFKLKKYLLSVVDLLLDEDQLNSRRICHITN